jgi:hypothetical protein
MGKYGEPQASKINPGYGVELTSPILIEQALSGAEAGEECALEARLAEGVTQQRLSLPGDSTSRQDSGWGVRGWL